MLALAAADLDVVTVNGIVADLQGIKAQALTFADFQFVEIIGRAIGQRSPLIQLFIITRSCCTG